MTDFSLHDLEAIIAERANSGADDSWTVKLVRGGMEKAGKKFAEESAETLIAALVQDNESLAAESADLLYHWLVVLHLRGVAVDDVMAILKARTVQSGLAEKAARPGRAGG